jgi:hypothetical protein
MKDEKDLQTFVASNPWLLDLNYERIPSLDRNGTEYFTTNRKRFDLVLRNRATGCPVIVEFKFVPFYRENVGQILEYRARTISELNNEDKALFGIFGQSVSTPELVLVVKNCDDFSRTACNMSGIRVIEFKNSSTEFNQPMILKKIEDFTHAFEGSPLPLSFDRPEEIETNVYQRMKDVMVANSVLDNWPPEKKTSGKFFHPKYSELFINRWLFSEEDFSFGIYEDILGDNSVVLTYYVSDEELFNRVDDFFKKRKVKIAGTWDDEGYFDYRVDLKTFLADTASIFEARLKLFLEARIHLKS